MSHIPRPDRAYRKGIAGDWAMSDREYCPNCSESESIIRHPNNTWECPNCSTVWVHAPNRHPQDPITPPLQPGTPGSRSTVTITITIRELGALERFISRKTVAGDVGLVESVLREIVDKARPGVANK
jgi:ribosomal protein S27AE